MAHLWKAGDLAVCVDDGPIKMFGSYSEVAEHQKFAVENLRRGKIYRVSSVQPMLGGFIAVVCKADRVGGCSDRFRPIKPASRKFTEAMRSLKPQVEA